MQMNQAERLAENESLFRKVNERINELQAGEWDVEAIDFMCECADETCLKVIRLQPAEYERIRNNPTHFVVLPGHEVEDVEDVVERHADYVVVEKHAETAQRVIDADPRL